MEESQKERLYSLLPTIYRVRDTLQGQPLRALMDALESEFRIVEQDMDALYDNWFIETCDDWVVPYIASQIGVYSSDDTRKLFPGQRRQVADTIAYRRRKGMVAILEHVLRDVTGWYVRLVEYGQLLSLASHLRNITGRGRFADLHHTTELAMLGGAFETTAHTIDIHRIAPATTSSEPQSRALQGKYSPGNTGVFVWRLRSYLMSMVPARLIMRAGERDLPPGCFTFDPLGRDIPLFTLPQEVADLTERPDAVNLPGPISRVAFANGLQEYRAQHRHITAEGDLFAGEDLLRNSIYYGPERSLCVMLNGQSLPPAAVVSADLSQWDLPLTNSHKRESAVAIDVMLGRLRLLHRQSPVDEETVEVNYCYGFSADLGGGPYIRQSPPAATPRQRINVLQGGKVSTLSQALKEWETCYSAWEQRQESSDSQLDKPRCTIHIVDNGFYEGDLVINLPENADLVIEATDGARPVIHGTLTVNSEQGSAHLQLNGLLIDGKLDINGSLNLEILHCALMPHGLEARHHRANTAPTRITIDHSITGPIHLRNVKSELLVTDSIIDHASGNAIDSVHSDSGRGPLIDLERVTIFGKVQLQELRLAQDVIFTAPVEVKQQHCGLVCFSYVPARSHTPRREHCQPQRAIHAQSNSQLPDRQGQSEENEPVYPLFTSTRYGDAAYAQLDNCCSPQIRRGASNGSEMGAFNSLRQPQRQDNISQMLDEYLPFGLDAGVFYVT